MRLKSFLTAVVLFLPQYCPASTFDVFDDWKVYSISGRLYTRAYAVSQNEQGEKLFYWCFAYDQRTYCSGFVDIRERCKHDLSTTFILSTNGESRAGEMTCAAKRRKTGQHYAFHFEKIEKLITSAQYDDVISFSYHIENGKFQPLYFSSKGVHRAIARVKDLLERHKSRNQ